MNIRLYNIKLMSMSEGMEILPQGELWVEGNRISYSGASDLVPAIQPVWDREMNGQGNFRWRLGWRRMIFIIFPNWQ